VVPSELQKLLEKDGWALKNREGSHRHLIHPQKPER
jgi:predicted RNA binding protein YcfA (HicA-like mRNA interferase family)